MSTPQRQPRLTGSIVPACSAGSSIAPDGERTGDGRALDVRTAAASVIVEAFRAWPGPVRCEASRRAGDRARRVEPARRRAMVEAFAGSPPGQPAFDDLLPFGVATPPLGTALPARFMR